MSVTRDEVLHIARLARIDVPPERLDALAAELSSILSHMDVLEKVDTKEVEPAVGVGDHGTPLRADAGPAIPLGLPPESFAPEMKDGFFLVPRLATHGDEPDRAP